MAAFVGCHLSWRIRSTTPRDASHSPAIKSPFVLLCCADASPQRRVLVTGAAGFIGFHTALRLAQRGDQVVGLDNFNPYYDVQLKRDRVKQLQLQAPQVTVVEGDITDEPALRRLFDTHRFTHVLHLAAQAGVRYSLEHPLEYAAAAAAATDAGVRLVVVSVRIEPASAVPGGGCGEPARIAICGDQAHERAGRPRLPPSVRAVGDRSAVLYGVWPVGTARHGVLRLRRGDACPATH
eukprot:ctg_1892.g715